MASDWRETLNKWKDAGLVDAETASRIAAYEAAYESEHGSARGLHWPVLIALIFGAITLGAGVLLFVAAHWDAISPRSRFALVALLVTVFHGIGALQRNDRFRSTFHALGTLALGAGIALATQIFQLPDDWASLILLWAAGAAAGWLLLRDLPQAALTAVLAPAWLGIQYDDWSRYARSNRHAIVCGALLWSLAYFSAVTPRLQTALRRTLMWIGGIVLIPAVLGVANDHVYNYRFAEAHESGPMLFAAGWVLAIAGPVTIAWLLRKDAVWTYLTAAVWALTLDLMAFYGSTWLVYAWCAAGSGAMVFWGLYEARAERVNFGVAGFALTVLLFYVSNVFDKLGRSMSLIGLGVLLLGGGWWLERTRRRLMERI